MNQQDIVALIVQAIGGGSASKAVQSDDANPEVYVNQVEILSSAYWTGSSGGHIMLAGIVIQLGMMSFINTIFVY